MNQTANSSMPRSTAEALKQIQKQGLSISIISGESPKTFAAETAASSKETRSKQNTVPIENLVNPSRSSDNKQTICQTRQISNTSVETRASSAQSVLSTNQVVQTGNVNKSNPSVSAVSEIKTLNTQRLGNVNSVESKNQTPNRTVHIEKTPTSVGRLSQNSSFSENKTHNNRNIQNAPSLIDSKTPVRNNQAESKSHVIQTRTLNQNLASDNKTHANQTRSCVGSPPLEGKSLSNQGRLSQNCSTPVLEKSIDGQRNQLQISELKTPISQSKVISVRQSDGRTLSTTKGTQNVKLVSRPRVISQFHPNNTQSNNVSANKQLIDKSPMTSLSERPLNPFRVASNLNKSLSEDKPIFKVARVAQNIAITENQAKIAQPISTKTENKAISQVIKISELSSELHQGPLSFDKSEILTSKVNTMPIQKTAVKRVAHATSTPTGKRKCMKITSLNVSEQSGSQSDINTLSSDESPVKEKKVFNLKTLTPGLTITPVHSSTPSTSGSNKKEANQNVVVLCPSCKQMSFNITSCDHCHIKINSPVCYQYKNSQPDSASIVVTQNVTTSIEKSMQIFYHIPGGSSQKQSFQIQQSNSKLIKLTPRKGRPKRRRYAEPVCYTLSSDEEEAVPFESIHEVENRGELLYPMESEGSKSEHSSASDLMHDESAEFEDPQYPGVTSLSSNRMNNEDDEEEEEEEEEDELEHEMDSEEDLMDEGEEQHDFEGEDEELEEEEEEEDLPPKENNKNIVFSKIPLTPPQIILKCRSIRIGSLKVHPIREPAINVHMTEKGITFPAYFADTSKAATLTLRPLDTAGIWIHFGKCLPIIFAFTTKGFGETVRKSLNISKASDALFDPLSEDVKKNKLTFLIDALNEEQKNFLRNVFPGPEKLKEIDQKEANEILVKSTPQVGSKQHQSTIIKIITPEAQLQTASSLPTMQSGIVNPANLANQSTSKSAPAKPVLPVTKMLTYPPPPQTGGIAINSADFATLDEGEFLNDAILDFYLKYVFYEKLSRSDREKTHVFSSFFYPRLTQKPDRPRPGDEAPKTMQVRRHNQVKTWTKHVDIFSKDYIIIPVNQHNHWFLAFICYPGRVPDAPIIKTEPNTTKCTDDVTSTDDQALSRVIIKEEIDNGEDIQNQDENSSSNSQYEVEEPTDSDEEPSSEIPDSSTHPDANVIVHESNQRRKETPCILIFDSLSGPNRWRIASTLREYLEMEWKIRKGTKKVFDRNTMQGFIMKCPQQTNFSDCGLYVLQFVESFFEHPIPYFGNPMPDLTNWFSDVKISKKREQLKDLIRNLQKKYHTKQVGITIKKIAVSSPVVTAPQSDNR